MGMPGQAAAARRGSGRWWPEAALAVLACAIFLGFLGSPELWGKREQRAAAEALDTVENGHWLVAQIQGRPRLEKPPLLRWSIAVLLMVTGSRDEWAVRLPGALAALATIALTYELGRRMGGRRLALASAMILCTTALFVSEFRQAGNDGPLALFTTMSLYAAWRRLDRPTGSRRWCLLSYAAMGLGFLCKGPIILLLVGMTVVPYLAANRRLAEGARLLIDARGLVVLLILALCWPVPVLLADPNALGVWTTEIGQKTGLLRIAHRDRAVLGLGLPLLSLPWSVAALAGAALPLVRGRRVRLPWKPSAVWFPWWWSVGNLAVFSCWAVAKPNYYVPCLPGLALLTGIAWIRLARVARSPGRPAAARVARLLIGLQWLVLLAIAVAAPLAGRTILPAAHPAWLVMIGGTALAGIGLGWRARRQGRDAMALLPVTATLALGVVAGYGAVAPAGNETRGHRQLARRLERLVPRNVNTVRFYHEIDEGLWFYLRGSRLAPVPGSQPRYSESHAKIGDLMGGERSMDRLAGLSAILLDREQARLIDWLERRGRDEPYLLIREALYQRLAPAVADRATLLHREQGMDRMNLVLLRAHGDDPRVAGPTPAGLPRR
jgi:4-amino-4-deoxy-L-arabinose transferase-like glycosyltransferase